MAKLPQSFTSDESDDITPTGEYLAEIVKTEMKETNAKDGEFLSLHFKVLEGAQKGAMIFCNLNLINKNETAVKIANSQLKKIILAVGKDPAKVVDSDELKNIPLMISVVKRPDDDAYPGADIKKFSKAGSGAASGAMKANPFKKK